MTATKDEVLSQLERILMRVRNLDCQPQPKDALAEDLGCTSFDMMVLAVEIEQAFDIAIDYSLLQGVRTVSDLADAVCAMIDRLDGEDRMAH